MKKHLKRFKSILVLVILALVTQMLTPLEMQAASTSLTREEQQMYYEKMAYLLETYVDPEYFRGEPQSLRESEEEYNELRQVALEVTRDCDTQYEKIKAITKYVADRIHYDYPYYNGLSNWTYARPYDVYQGRRAVCEGYANLVMEFCFILDIPCMRVTGANHAYNGAYDSENGRWVLTDATWCSGNKYTTKQEWVYGDSNFEWFDITTETIRLHGTYAHEIFNLDGILYNSVYYRIQNMSGSIENASYREYKNWVIRPTGATEEVVKIPSKVEELPVFCDAFQYEPKVKKLDLSESGIAYLYSNAFIGCTNLEEVVFPDTLGSIDRRIFYNCTSLKEADFSNTQIQDVPSNCFENCTSLKKVILPKTVTSIKSEAFLGCPNIEEIDLSSTNITEIEDDVFEGCSKLKKITFPTSLKTLDPYTFSGCNLIQELDFSNTQLETIPSYCFKGLECLQTVRFPKTLKTLGYRAFYDCENIEELDFSDTQIAEIPASYFEMYTNLKKVLLPKTLTTIGEAAFGRCTSLEEIDLEHTGVTQIPVSAFSQCYKLTKVSFPATLESVGNSAFNATSIVELDFYHTQLKTVDRYAFYENDELVTIKFPNTIESLGEYAFYRSSCKDIYVYLPINSTFDQSVHMQKDFAWWGSKRIIKRLDENGNLIPTVTAPKNPSSVKAVLYGYDDVKVSWNKVSGASGYKVYYKKSTSAKWASKVTTGTSIKLANLADGVKYNIKVAAYKTASGDKYYSSGKSTSIYTLKKITGVKVAKSGSKVKVSWKNISGETGYQISKATKKSKTSIVYTYKTSTGKSKTITATKKKTYYYKVRAYTVVSGKKIYGPWSATIKYTRR